ncbi:MAG TPA: SPFH domain-containing protein, partial [Anaerolineales bacterium]|nr:SPFH domain-containing protein [Anaerolineales bacterium]
MAKQFTQIGSRVSHSWSNLWQGGRLWGYFRLGMALLLLGFFIRLGVYVYNDPRLEPAILSSRGMRYLVFPLFAFIAALLLSANYVRDVYELPSVKDGLRYMLTSLFSILHSRLQIRDGKRQLKLDETNLVDRIGGPGYVNIAQGSVALVERLTSPANVYGNGSHYLTRWERVKEIATLDDQHDSIQEISATTKEGIEVIVKQVQFRYRLRAAREGGDYMRRLPEKPYPYTIQSMRNMTYQRNVSLKGLTSLEDSVRTLVRIAIRRFVQGRQIDYLTAPGKDDPDPREALRREFASSLTRKRFRNLGIDLLWIDIGHFSIKEDDVDKERINNWGAKWVGTAEVKRSFGEAQRLALLEIGRAEAQAGMLDGIVRSMREALEGATTPEDRNRILRNLVMARTAQILDGWTETHRKAG